ncbi:MAG TPA: single-stranded-DNA-specific exonuclease RecJ, partial [Longimicrobiales bacterium]
LLVLRGHALPADARTFLRPRLDQLQDPAAMAGLGEAVQRIERALDGGEKILVHGDYDVDGVCAAALFTRVLRRLGGQVEAFVPHRVTDGYDLGRAGIQRAVEFGASLILTGDCGIVAHEAIEAARSAGIDVIVTDHHTPDTMLPPAVAVVNPNRPDCGYPEKTLCGTGVAFKLCQALADRRGLDKEWLWYHLDLVALATVADLVPLTGENRVFVRYGLKLLRESRHAGVRALVRSAGLDEQAELVAGHVSHILGPRINAAGRLGDACDGVHLLLCDDDMEAARLAQGMETQNRERRSVDRDMLAQALEQLERDYDPDRDYAVVLAGEGWHPGVIGIVASRVVERIHRPTVLIALNGGPHARGSARSIPGFHLYDALATCAGMLVRFGGHKYAAGLDIVPERIPELREALNAYAHAMLTPRDLIPELEIDLELSLAEANADLLRFLRHFGPFGVGNPSPVLAVRGARVLGRPKIVGENHLKLELTQGGARLRAIGFRMADHLSALAGADLVDVA